MIASTVVATIEIRIAPFTRRTHSVMTRARPTAKTSTGQPARNRFLAGWPVLVFAVGLALVITLWVRRVKGAILISIVATTVLAIIVEAIADVGPAGSGDSYNPVGWNLNVPTLPDKIVGT